MDRTDLQVRALDRSERPFGLFEVLVGAHDITGLKVGLGEAGPQDVEPVERSFRGDLRGLAGVGERGVSNRGLEVLAHPVTLQRRTCRKTDQVGPGERPGGDTVSDRG